MPNSKIKILDISNKKDLRQWIQSTITSTEANQSYLAPRNPVLSDLVQRNLGYVSICARLNSQMVAQTPLYLYKPVATGRGSLGLKKMVRANHLNSKYMKRAFDYHSDFEVVQNHPFLESLDNPNDYQTGSQLRFQLAMSNEITGNAFRYWDWNNMQSHFLFPQWVRVIPDEQREKIQGKYQYGRDVSNPTSFTDTEVEQQMLFPSITNPYYGDSWLNGIIGAADAWQFTQNFIATLMKNEGRPEHILFLEGVETEKELQDVEQTLFQKMKQAFKGGVPLVTGGSKGKPTLINFGHSPKDMGNIEQLNEMERTISNAAGIPESILKLNESNVASARVGEYRWAKSTIMPRLAAEADSLTRMLHIIDPSTTEWFFAPENIVPEDVDADAKRGMDAYKSGLITKNEARIQLGLDRIEDGGDEFLDESKPGEEEVKEAITVIQNSKSLKSPEIVEEETVEELIVLKDSFSPPQGEVDEKSIMGAIDKIKANPCGLNIRTKSVKSSKFADEVLDLWELNNPTLRQEIKSLITSNKTHQEILVYLKERN